MVGFSIIWGYHGGEINTMHKRGEKEKATYGILMCPDFLSHMTDMLGATGKWQLDW